MKKIKVITSNNRGFLLNLFNYKNNKYYFEYSNNSIYEVSSRLKNIISKMIKCRLFDFVGLFQIIRCKHQEEDISFSYNRFLKSEKPYVILLENPAALVNYCWNRPKSLVSKMKLKRLFKDKNLKAIVCMSKACYKGFFELYDVSKELKVTQIYPMILDSSCNDDDIRKKCNADILECLYISSDFYLKGGRDILNICNYIEDPVPIHITIVTKSANVSDGDRKFIENNRMFSLVEFNLSKDELDTYYNKAAVLLNPTRGDSFSLVTLEALKFGCAIIGSDVYAIKEMVKNGKNGYIQYPQYRYWSDKNIPNKNLMEEKDVRGYQDDEMTKMLFSKLYELSCDREKLYEMCVSSLKMSRGDSFGEKSIMKKWITLFDECIESDMGQVKL